MESSDSRNVWGTDAPNISVPMEPFQGVTIAFSVLAMLGAIVRTFIRTSQGKQKVLDDFILVPFACSCLIASTVLLQLGAPHLFRLTTAVYFAKYEPFKFAEEVSVDEMLGEVSKTQRYVFSFGALIWLCIFAVKFCYLRFFRLIIDRQGAIVHYCNFVMIITLISAPFQMSASFITCPRFGLEASICGTPAYVSRRQIVGIITAILDITTDLMIISIPFYIVSRIRMRFRQKVGLGFFLCLSLVMIIIALVRVARERASDFDIWATFWLQIEGCVAVLMITLTAFRTVFVSQKQSTPDLSMRRSSFNTRSRHVWRKVLPFSSYFLSNEQQRLNSGSVERAAIITQDKQRGHGHGHPRKVDVYVTRPTLLGMRSAIRGGGMESTNRLTFPSSDRTLVSVSGSVPVTASEAVVDTRSKAKAGAKAKTRSACPPDAQDFSERETTSEREIHVLNHTCPVSPALGVPVPVPARSYHGSGTRTRIDLDNETGHTRV